MGLRCDRSAEARHVWLRRAGDSHWTVEPQTGRRGLRHPQNPGKYVLFGTAWSTDRMRKGTYNLYYCTSNKVAGPYGPRRFAGRFCGHGTPFQDKRRRWWTTAFLDGRYASPEHVAAHGTDPSEAQTINRQGLTLVPLDVRIEQGDVYICAEDPIYARPGPEEVQEFLEG